MAKVELPGTSVNKGKKKDQGACALVHNERSGALGGPLLAKRLSGAVFRHVGSARGERSSSHHLATPGHVALSDVADVAAPATFGHVPTVGVVGEQLVALIAAVQDVPVRVEGVGVDDIVPIEAEYAVVLVGAYALVEHVVVVGAVTGEVVTARLRDGHRYPGGHHGQQHRQPEYQRYPAHLLTPFLEGPPLSFSRPYARATLSGSATPNGLFIGPRLARVC